MRLWQWVWLWLWLVGLGAIETGEKWPREQWREEGKGGEGQCPFWCWEAKPPSLCSPRFSPSSPSRMGLLVESSADL